MDKSVTKAIADLSKRMNELQRTLETYVNMKNASNKSDIDYIAMMSDIELPAKLEEVDVNEDE